MQLVYVVLGEAIPILSGMCLWFFSPPLLNNKVTPHQVFLSQGVGMGLGMGLVFVPTVSIPSHYFKRRRALVAGIVLSGNSTGAIIFPISTSEVMPFIFRHSDDRRFATQ